MLKKLLLALVLLGAAPAYAEDAAKPYLTDLIKQPAYSAAWKGMLSGERVPPWVKKFGTTNINTSAPSKPVTVGGELYTLSWICKPFDCKNNEVYVLFAPGARQAWGLLISGDKRSWLGRPDTAIKAAILSGVE